MHDYLTIVYPPSYFRSCGLSRRHVRGSTPALRAVPQSRAAAGQRILPASEGGKKADFPEEVHASMGRAFRLRLGDDFRVRVWDPPALRWQWLIFNSSSNACLLCVSTSISRQIWICSANKNNFCSTPCRFAFFLSVCKHFACVPVHGRISGESCAEPVSTKQWAVRELTGR